MLQCDYRWRRAAGESRRSLFSAVCSSNWSGITVEDALARPNTLDGKA